jgi:hypothetical protein
MINSFKDKYSKYKLKYNNLKIQIAGNKNRISGDEHYDTNPSIAAEFYQKAVDEGDLEAHFKLGKMYEKGIGVMHDNNKAQDLYRIAALKGHDESLNSFRENIFNNFLNNLFTIDELRDKNQVYFLIGTYPLIYKETKWNGSEPNKIIENSLEYNIIIRNILIEHENKLTHDMSKYNIDDPLSINELELSNRIYYFIDSRYNLSYMNSLKIYLTPSAESKISDTFNTYNLPIRFNEGYNYLKIHFTRLNVVLYIIKMFVPSQYSFDENRTRVGNNSSNQMVYSKKCEPVNTWNGIYCNILNFLNKPNNKFYLLNDALWFYNGNSLAENRYFEFFCEFGYILHKLYQKNKGKQVFVVLPNNRSNEFFNNTNIIPKFTNLHDVYIHNFGIS